MNIWPAADLFEFCRLIRLLDDCFVLRRTFQRLERDEITIREAIALLTAEFERRP